MAVKTKKTFPNAVGANGQSSTVFTPVEVQLNNQDDLDVYVTLSGGTRVLQLRQSTGGTAQSSHPQVNDTTGLYFPAVSAGTTLYNYTLSTDNNTITFSTALPSGAVVSIERRTRDADSSYTNFASGSTIRATDLNNSSTESNFTAQEARNKAFELEGRLFNGEAVSSSFITSDDIIDGSIVNNDINTNAGIDVSKLAGSGTPRQILEVKADGSVGFVNDIRVLGTLVVDGLATFTSNALVTGGQLKVQANNSELAVNNGSGANKFLVDSDTGNTNIHGTLSVVDGALFSSTVGISGLLDANAGAHIDNLRLGIGADNEITTSSGNLELNSASGTTRIDDNLIVTGNLTYNGTFNNLTTTEIAILDGATLSTAELNTLDGITSTTAELNILDGVTATAAEINKLDGITSSTAELNILDGVTATASELNTLDGITASVSELNILDGVTASTTEINKLDGVTASTAELNILDGVTATATELNLNDGQTATPSEVNILDGATLNTNELNILDGVTASTTELNLLDGKSVVTTITGSATDTQLPSAQAVNERIVELVTEVGGFHPIANETSFPSTNPDINDGAGTIVSLKSLSSAFSTGAGVTTKVFTNGAGSGVNVTVNGLPASTTFQAGKGLLLETTSTLHTYNYHRLVLDESGVSNADALVTNFNEKYYGPLSSNPATRPSGANRQNGDLYFNTSDGKMKVYNGSHASGTWDDVAAPGNFFINTLSSSSGSGGGSAAFNNTATRFTLSNPPLTAQQLLVSVNGVIQKPNSGTSPSEGFAIDGADIIFASAPATNAPHFIVTIGSSVNIGTPSDGTVTSAKIVDGTIVNADISSSAAIAKSKLASLDIVNADVNASASIAGTKISPNFGSQNIVTTGNGGIGTTSVPTGFKLAVNGDLSLGETSGSDNTFIDQKQNGQLELINSGRDDNTGAIRINRMNSIGGDTTYFRDVNIYDGKGSSVMYVDGSAASVGIGTTSPSSLLELSGTSPRITFTDTAGTNDIGKITSASGALYLQQRDGSGHGEIIFRTENDSTALERMRIKNDGNVKINDGNLIIGTSGHGIDFSANQGATGMTSELFDHYEEGTWTPAVTSGLSAGAISYNSRSAKYTRVGNVVYFTFHMNINSATLDSGALKFGGLPFTSANTSHTAGGAWKIFTNGNIDAGATYKVEGNTTDIAVVTGAGDAMAANATSINAGHRHMAYWGFYYV